MSFNLKLLCVFAISAILGVNGGVILEKITKDLQKLQTDIDQQMKQYGNYFNQNGKWFQNGFKQPDLNQNILGQPTFGQGIFPETENRGQTSFNSGNTVGFETLGNEQNSGVVNTFETNGVSKKVEISTVTSATVSESTTPGKEGRRIISAHSNCGPGYVADARGRCREHF